MIRDRCRTPWLGSFAGRRYGFQNLDSLRHSLASVLFDLQSKRQFAALGTVIQHSARKIRRSKGDIPLAGAVRNREGCANRIQRVYGIAIPRQLPSRTFPIRGKSQAVSWLRRLPLRCS